MGTERRNFNRVGFGRGYFARMMAIDGTWHRECRIDDVSETGAKLSVRGSVDGIDTKEFFLVLSPTGNAHRRCERVWVNGDEVGVRFLREQPAHPPRRTWTHAEQYPSIAPQADSPTDAQPADTPAHAADSDSGETDATDQHETDGNV